MASYVSASKARIKPCAAQGGIHRTLPIFQRGEQYADRPFGKGGKWYALNDVRKCLNDLNHDCCKGQTFRSPPAKPEVYRDELTV